jgi:Ca2+-transporting ATPase
LTADEVEQRQRLYGSNDILGDRSSGWGNIARDTARDPMVWLLVATALLFAWLGDFIEASVLALALVPIAGMDAYLHRRTQATTEGLAGRLTTQARVLRDGGPRDVPSAELVPGDLVIVNESESFPADGVLVAGINLQADESALTGEAMPVRKRPFKGTAEEGETSLDNEYWGAAGTRLLTGEGRLRVVFTGGETLYGEIVRFAREGQHERTPLQSAISTLVAGLVGIALLVCVVLAATRYYQGFGLLDAFLSAVTLAVAALPEEFPVAFTFFLAVGVYRLARRQALVRRAVVVENIGRVTCICSDKTGTITEGKVTLAHSLPVEAIDAVELRRCAAIASRPGSGDSGFLVATKGAPETIFSMSSLSPEEKTTWLANTAELAAAGHKVLACAKKNLNHWSGEEPDQGYQFLGLLAFVDPVRDGVREAVAKAQEAGIRVIMVTGDHLTTAAAIAREIGLGGETPRLIEGEQLKGLVSSRELKGFDVVARAIPAQKLDLVRALKASGDIVAVTGDGVNDVPALRGADIGIAMGERGTRAAREVASIVLLDDNFRTIVRAISEGRQLFRNLKLSFAYLLMMHMPLVATAALVPFAGFPLLYLPMHVVWLELIIHPTALLVFQELPTSDKLDPVQRNPKLRFFSWQEWTLIASIGALVIAMIVVGYARSLGISNDVEHARSMAMVALVVASATMTAGLTRLRSRSSVIAVLVTIGSAVLLVQVAPLARLLHLSPLHLDDWLIAGLGGAIVASLAAFIPSLGNKREVAACRNDE